MPPLVHLIKVNMERETKFFQREKYNFKLNCWLTANEMREIKLAPYQGLEFSEDELKKTIQGELISKMESNTENKTIEKFVVEFDGSQDNILNRILESRSEVIEDILEEIKNISEEENTEKKNLETNTGDSSKQEKENTTKE